MANELRQCTLPTLPAAKANNPGRDAEDIMCVAVSPFEFCVANADRGEREREKKKEVPSAASWLLEKVPLLVLSGESLHSFMRFAALRICRLHAGRHVASLSHLWNETRSYLM
eukprot:scpid25064/ scgid7968/ 